MRVDEIKNEIDETKKWEDKIKQKDLKYEADKHRYDFQRYGMIRSFGESIYFCKISMSETDLDQTNLFENMKKI